MQHFFKTTELTNQYAVAPKTVRNWIQATKNGSLDLQLVSIEGKDFIANTDKNRVKIKEMVEARRKYRNTNAVKTVGPTDEFYEIYSPEQVFDIIRSLTVYREIPLQYSYFGEGAKYWDRYVERLQDEELPNMLNSTIKLLDLSYTRLDDLLGDYANVNVVDLGVGNAMHVKGLLAHLQGLGILNRYTGIDMSNDMLDVAHKNVKRWFGESITFEPHARDITNDRFTDLLIPDYFAADADTHINLITFVGGTLANLREPAEALQVIRKSMNDKDLLVFAHKLDTPNSRRYFDFHLDDEVKPLDQQDRFMLDLLGIDESLYTVEQLYDEHERSRFIRVRLKMALSISFQLGGQTRTVDLNKDEAVLLWRYRHHTGVELVNLFHESGFDLLHSDMTEDREYLLTISRIKTGSAQEH